MISVDTFKEVLETNLDCKEKNIKYIDSIPRDIGDAFFDNEYVTNIGTALDVTLESLLGVDLYNEYAWFMWDWKPGYIIEINEHKYIINNIDDFMAYLVAVNKVSKID